MTKERLLEIKSQIENIFKEIKEDDDRYLVYQVEGLYSFINSLDYLSKHYFD